MLHTSTTINSNGRIHKMIKNREGIQKDEKRGPKENNFHIFSTPVKLIGLPTLKIRPQPYLRFGLVHRIKNGPSKKAREQPSSGGVNSLGGKSCVSKRRWHLRTSDWYMMECYMIDRNVIDANQWFFQVLILAAVEFHEFGNLATTSTILRFFYELIFGWNLESRSTKFDRRTPDWNWLFRVWRTSSTSYPGTPRGTCWEGEGVGRDWRTANQLNYYLWEYSGRLMIVGEEKKPTIFPF